MRKLMLLVMTVIASVPFADRWTTLYAQEARARVPAWVAISPEMEGSANPFRLARFAGRAPQDVILLAPGADAATLTQAVDALLAARRAAGDEAESDALLRVPQAGQRRRELPWAGRVIDDARAAAPREIPGIGRVRAVRIWLPAQWPRSGGR
jgi:hypothetical protein